MELHDGRDGPPSAGGLASSVFSSLSVCRFLWADFQLAYGDPTSRFDATAMKCTIEAIHEARWDAWSGQYVLALSIFAKHGMFSDSDKDALIRQRPATGRIEMAESSHDVHLDAFDQWIEVLPK